MRDPSSAKALRDVAAMERGGSCGDKREGAGMETACGRFWIMYSRTQSPGMDAQNGHTAGSPRVRSDVIASYRDADGLPRALRALYMLPAHARSTISVHV